MFRIVRNVHISTDPDLWISVPLISVVDPDPVGSASFWRTRIGIRARRSGSESVSVSKNCKDLTTLSHNENSVKILKLWHLCTLTIKTKQCKLPLLWIKVRKFFFQIFQLVYNLEDPGPDLVWYQNGKFDPDRHQNDADHTTLSRIRILLCSSVADKVNFAYFLFTTGTFISVFKINNFRKASSPQNKTSSTSKLKNFFTFSNFVDNFCPPGSESGSWIPMRIRIPADQKQVRIYADPNPGLIHNTGIHVLRAGFFFLEG